MMLKTGGVIRLFIILAIFIAILGSAFEVSHNPNQFSFYTDRGFHRVRAPDFYPSGNPGAPELPVKYLHYIIPPNMEAEGIRIISSSTAQISGSYYIFPAQRPVPLCSIPPWTPPDSIIYNSDSLYPNNPIEIVRNGIFDGARLVTIAVYPLRYRPKSRRVFINRNISFEFQFGSVNIPERPRVRGINAQKVYNGILSSVENDNDISLYYQPPTLIPDAPPPTPTPATYTIIANDAIQGMMEEFQPLADWLTEKGIPAVVYPLSLALNSPGVDDAERLRNFIINGYKHYGLTWVLLGGDAGIIPYRKASSRDIPPPPSEEDLPPSDLYFSDMNGDWDCDYGPGQGDGFWGEPNHDAVDIYPEVFVGRILTRNPIETRNWVEKDLIYEQYGSTMRELYGQTTWIYDSIGRVGHPHGGPLYPLPETREKFPGYFTHFNFDSRGGYEAGEALKWGTGLYQIYCHGGPREISCDGRTCYHVYAYSTEPPNPEHGLNYLDNDGRYYVVYAISCWVAAYDPFGPNPYNFTPTDTSFADGFTDTYARKGAAAFLGNTRSGYYWTSHKLHDAFCKLLFGIEVAPYSLGVIEGWSKVYYPSHWHLVHAHNLFGSPETEPWINEPEEMYIDHPTFIPVGQTVEFPVVVQSDAGPLADVRVCLYKKDGPAGPFDIYQIGWTDGSGKVTFIVYPQSIGTLRVTCARPRLPSTVIPEYTQYLPTRTICRVGIGGDQKKEPEAAQRLERPEKLCLTTTSPIPAAGHLKVFYGLSENERAKIALYDLSGREAMVLKDERMGAGYYAEVFNLNRRRLSKGIYWLQLRTKDKAITKKLVLMR